MRTSYDLEDAGRVAHDYKGFVDELRRQKDIALQTVHTVTGGATHK